MAELRRIALWYGRRQQACANGMPQRWFNILGRIGDSRGLARLTAQVGDAEPTILTIGPDGRRLVGDGDFNVEVDLDPLPVGTQPVELVALYEDGETVRERVILEVHERTAPVLPLSIDWSETRLPGRHAQIVDGLWQVHGRYVTTVEPGYDRLIAIGDVSWRDFDVTVPVVIHGINSGAYDTASVHTGAGLVMRWKGHSRWNPDGRATGQPRYGPVPYGAIAWWTTWNDERDENLNIFDVDLVPREVTPRRLEMEVPYVFRARVSTLGDGRSSYHLKVWPDDDPEPAGWDVSAVSPVNSLESGSLLLAAHETNASFGPVRVTPIHIA